MSREKLIKKLKEKNPQLNLKELDYIIEVFSENISNVLLQGKTVEIRDIGRWYHRKLKENFKARNPKTNELIYKPERVRVRFKASKKLNKLINE